MLFEPQCAHSPYNVPEEYYELYKDETAISETQKRFYGMITNIDDNFFKLLKKLEVLGIAENTIVIFTTDNGTAAGYKVDGKTGTVNGYNAGMRGTKGSEYDGGHRVPFFIKWPKKNIDGGKRLSSLTAHVDMLPTLASLAGIDFKPVKTMDGMDISSYLIGTEEIPDRMLVTDTQRVLWPIKGKQSSVMNGYWRLVVGKELYNVEKNPGQEMNLADQNSDRVNKMNAFYERWRTDVIKETKYSVIDIGTGGTDVLTCHDANTRDYYPPWSQALIRQGYRMKPAPFSVNIVKAGTYKFCLSRWPRESGLALGDEELDGISATSHTDGRINGTAMKFTKAHLKISGQEKEVNVDNSLKSAALEITLPQGETEFTTYYYMENGK